MASDVGICNNALLMIGEKTIADFQENSVAAKLSSNLFESSRNAVLRLHPWNFAIQRINLAPKAQAPVYGYSNAFQMPGDALRLLEVYDITDYKIEGRDILCNATSIYIKYVARITDINFFDALFTETLQTYLAWKFAYPLTKSNTTKAEMRELFLTMLKAAKAVDAQEEPQDTVGDFPFINVR